MSDEEYKPRQKPVIDDEVKAELAKRSRMSHKRPAFKRQNWFRYKRLGDKWRLSLIHISEPTRPY